MQKLFLPKVSFEQIKATNELFSGSACASFTVHDVLYSIVFEASSPITSWWCVVEGSIGTESVELFLETPPPLQSVLPGVFPEESNDLPETVLLVAFDTLLEQALDTLSTVLGVAIAIKNIRRKPRYKKNDANTLFFALIDSVYSIRTTCALRFTSGRFSDSFASKLLPIMRQASTQIPGSYEIPVPCKLEIGYTLLTYRMLQHVEPRDIVFLDEYYPLTGNIIVRTRDDSLFRARWSQGVVTINEEIANDENQEEFMSSSSDMPVKITMDLGNVLIPMGEMKKLASGYVFTTEQSTASPVTLRIHGKRFAIGELLDVEGRIGVRIVDIVLNKKEEEYAPSTPVHDDISIEPLEDESYNEEDYY
ncbi:MAG: FliM/FliN family flagellar motor switch protein [Desulfovibrionaceae bacterium]|nr:FliM/FliN family flagellar motor switch protein [Desulfovibrionaceae bacterium]